MSKVLRAVLLICGSVAVILGLLWQVQGLGLLDWPVASRMSGSPDAARFGGLVAVLGVVMIWLGRRSV